MSTPMITTDTRPHVTTVNTLTEKTVLKNERSTELAPEFQSFDQAREVYFNLLNAIEIEREKEKNDPFKNDPDLSKRYKGKYPDPATVKAALDKYTTARELLLYKVNGELSKNNLSVLEKNGLIAILRTHLGDDVPIDLDPTDPKANDIISDIIETHKNGRVETWLQGLQKYVALNKALAEIVSVMADIGNTHQKQGDPNTMVINGKRILAKIQEVIDKFGSVENALFVSKKTGQEALDEVRAKARELGQSDAYDPNKPPYYFNIQKMTNKDGTETYYLTPNLAPIRAIFSTIGLAVRDEKGNWMEAKELSTIDFNTMQTAVDTQKEILKNDVTTFSTKTGDVNMKFDNLVKALMAYLSARLEMSKGYLTPG